MPAERRIEIIAECGINHQGNMQLADGMIRWAKHCGADTAKFQYYDPEAVLDRNHPQLAPCWDVVMETRLTPDDVSFLKRTCDELEIDFLCSVFDPADVPLFEEIGMERYKIASRSMYDKPLAIAIAKTKKPVIVSWGHYAKGKGWPAIWSVPLSGRIKKYNLYCVSDYPTALNDLEFFDNDEVTGRSWSIFDAGRFYGFSDHTQGLTAAAMAMAHGARLIEKHFTTARSLQGPDHACSMEVHELGQLCKMRDDFEQLCPV